MLHMWTQCLLQVVWKAVLWAFKASRDLTYLNGTGGAEAGGGCAVMEQSVLGSGSGSDG